jgi:shikimate dehydrogenase
MDASLPDPLTPQVLDSWRPAHAALAVLGFPIRHSISPQLHHAALAVMTASGHPELSHLRYYRFEVDPADLPATLPRLHAAGFLGLNLTIPHKVLATRLVTRIDPSAAPMGAVNTLRRTTTGYEGYNTDGYGLSTAVREELGRSLRGSHVVLLGAGGAARAAAVQALQEGCASLWIGNRSRDRLDELLGLLAPLSPATGGLYGFSFDSPPSPLPPDALVVNCTSAGMSGDASLAMDPALFPGSPACYDMVYKPAETPWLARARACGLPAANGLSMLVHQAARALEIWTGLPVPAAPMHLAAAQATGRT